MTCLGVVVCCACDTVAVSAHVVQYAFSIYYYYYSHHHIEIEYIIVSIESILSSHSPNGRPVSTLVVCA
jgi:hypothetical protein